MEKEKTAKEIIRTLLLADLFPENADLFLEEYAQEVRKEMFTKKELKAILYWYKVCEQEGLTDRHNDQAVKEKLTELLNLEEKGKCH